MIFTSALGSINNSYAMEREEFPKKSSAEEIDSLENDTLYKITNPTQLKCLHTLILDNVNIDGEDVAKIPNLHTIHLKNFVAAFIPPVSAFKLHRIIIDNGATEETFDLLYELLVRSLESALFVVSQNRRGVIDFLTPRGRLEKIHTLFPSVVLEKMQTLNLSNLGLTSIEWLHSLTFNTLFVLDLSNNNIVKINTLSTVCIKELRLTTCTVMNSLATINAKINLRENKLISCTPLHRFHKNNIATQISVLPYESNILGYVLRAKLSPLCRVDDPDFLHYTFSEKVKNNLEMLHKIKNNGK